MTDENPARTGRAGPVRPVDSPDRRDGEVYVMHPDVQLAVDVALATGRPVLVGGDHVRRLSDAQVRTPGDPLPDEQYVTPGPLWWAFAPRSAEATVSAKARARQEWADVRRGLHGDGGDQHPWPEINRHRSRDHAVVLIDEIDKADPDMPNSLLVPLGSNEFTVAETGAHIKKEAPRDPAAAQDPDNHHLIVITTNEERELPQAFLRRCVVAWLPEHDEKRLVTIAEAHFRFYSRGFTATDRQLAALLATELKNAREEARKQALRQPSTAEFLDALRACRSLGITPDDSRWDRLKRLVLLKSQQPEG
jgi:hypothetical protein